MTNAGRIDSGALGNQVLAQSSAGHPGSACVGLMIEYRVCNLQIISRVCSVD
jgi:hypothetical protein